MSTLFVILVFHWTVTWEKDHKSVLVLSLETRNTYKKWPSESRFIYNSSTWHRNIKSVKPWRTIIDLLARTEHSKHYENTPIQIYGKFHLQKSKNFQVQKLWIFHISAQNIDCGYSLEPPRRGGSNEYPQSMFYAAIRKIMYTPVNPSFTI